MHDLVELERGLTIVAERFLDDDACPPGPAAQPMVPDRFHDRLVGGGRGREVEQPVRVRSEREVELIERASQIFVAGVIGGRHEMQMLREAAPDLLVQGSRPAVLRDRAVKLLSVLLVAHWFPGGTDNGECGRKEALEREVVERGYELAL